ncbi:hypothetical protein V2W45_1249129, partial [Cenococcum geophilum]
LINSLAKESDYGDNNKDGESDIDEGKAENYNNGSDDSDIDDNNTRDGDSSDSDEGNEAYGCVG